MEYILAEHDVIGSIHLCPSNSSPGPDDVPTIMFKNCSGILAKTIALLWEQSLREGAVPESLKFGTVTAVFKGGDKLSPKTIAPSSSHVSKIFERILIKKIAKIEEVGVQYT